MSDEDTHVEVSVYVWVMDESEARSSGKKIGEPNK